jgi:hypothetical protein
MTSQGFQVRVNERMSRNEGLELPQGCDYMRRLLAGVLVLLSLRVNVEFPMGILVTLRFWN